VLWSTVRDEDRVVESEFEAGEMTIAVDKQHRGRHGNAPK
jgi:hypothetical protein